MAAPRASRAAILRRVPISSDRSLSFHDRRSVDGIEKQNISGADLGTRSIHLSPRELASKSAKGLLACRHSQPSFVRSVAKRRSRTNGAAPSSETRPAAAPQDEAERGYR